MKIIDMIIIFVLLVTFCFLYFEGKAHSKEVVLHTTKDVYFYNQTDKEETIILPDHERVNIEEMEKELDSRGMYTTKGGNNIYKGDRENTIYMEECNDED